MNGRQQRGQEKDIYSDELLVRFVSSSHLLFLVATDSE
jgi:hypothetical protein